MASAVSRLSGRFDYGLDLFNQLRREFRNYPTDWLSKGYQLGRSIQTAASKALSYTAGERPLLRDIPRVPGLVRPGPASSRILYRFRVRLFEKYGRTPKTFIVDVWSLRPLDAAALQNELYDRALAVYARSPGARRGGREKDVTEVQSDLIFIGRSY